jgi:hypothetical protein
MKLTLGQFLPVISSVVGDCNRERLLSLINQATENLLHKGPTHYTIGNFRFCLDKNCITWPRQIAVIEGIALCGVPLSIAGSWYEFLGNGPGAFGGGSCEAGSPSPSGSPWCGCGGGVLLERPEAVTFEDLSTPYLLQIQSTQNETGLTRILLQGYDENNQWIRTQDNGTWVDGEYVVLSSTPALTTKYFSSLVSVIKDESVGTTLVYEYRAPGVLRLLATYEWDECYPTYRRSYLPMLEKLDENGNSVPRSVYVRAKLRYYPVKYNNDWLLIGNTQAMKNMVQAIIKYDGDFMDIGQALESKAIQFLNDEERYYNPRSAIRSLNFQRSWGAGGNEIMNLYGC